MVMKYSRSSCLTLAEHKLVRAVMENQMNRYTVNT